MSEKSWKMDEITAWVVTNDLGDIIGPFATVNEAAAWIATPGLVDPTAPDPSIGARIAPVQAAWEDVEEELVNAEPIGVPQIDEPALPLPGDVQPNIEPENALDLAWGIIANVSGGDWSQQSEEWRKAATRWRDELYACPLGVATCDCRLHAARLKEKLA